MRGLFLDLQRKIEIFDTWMKSRSFLEKVKQNPDSASHNLRTDQSSSPEHTLKLFPELQTDVRGLANPLEEEPVLVVLVDRLPDRISAQLVISVTTWMRGEPMSRSVFTLVILRFLDLIFFKSDFSQSSLLFIEPNFNSSSNVSSSSSKSKQLLLSGPK
jgi:hypothetical protein